MISNTLRLIINISKTKIYYYIFLKNFLNKSILVNKVGKIKFLALRCRKKDLNS